AATAARAKAPAGSAVTSRGYARDLHGRRRDVRERDAAPLLDEIAALAREQALSDLDDMWRQHGSRLKRRRFRTRPGRCATGKSDQCGDDDDTHAGTNTHHAAPSSAGSRRRGNPGLKGTPTGR